jgi:hypothetical protein
MTKQRKRTETVVVANIETSRWGLRSIPRLLGLLALIACPVLWLLWVISEEGGLTANVVVPAILVVFLSGVGLWVLISSIAGWVMFDKLRAKGRPKYITDPIARQQLEKRIYIALGILIVIFMLIRLIFPNR